MSPYLWLALAGAVLLLGLVATLVRLPAHACCSRCLDLPATSRGHHLAEWHHGFLGIVVLAPFLPSQVAALVLVADDLLQHLMQTFGKDPYWRSPLKQLAAASWYKVFP